MLNSSVKETLEEDNLGSVNPYKVPEVIWSFVEEYFTNKYDVNFSSAYPKDQIERPTIVWKVKNRRPTTGSGGKGGIRNATGRGFNRFVQSDLSGYLTEEITQYFDLEVQFSVFANSSAIADEIAWDLENAIYEALGPVQNAIPGFNMAFSQQLDDDKFGNDLVVRTLIYRVIMTVKFPFTTKKLDSIVVNTTVPSQVLVIELSRDSSALELNLTTKTGYIINTVTAILYPSTSQKPLLYNVDYIISKKNDGTVILKWLENGKIPEIGEKFKVVVATASSIGTKVI